MPVATFPSLPPKRSFIRSCIRVSRCPATRDWLVRQRPGSTRGSYWLRHLLIVWIMFSLLTNGSIRSNNKVHSRVIHRRAGICRRGERKHVQVRDVHDFGRALFSSPPWGPRGVLPRAGETFFLTSGTGPDNARQQLYGGSSWVRIVEKYWWSAAESAV